MKHSGQMMIACLLFCWPIFSIYAQQGNVAAGGDVTGSGGSMSYSVGQTDYLIYGSEQGSLNLGLQQVWFGSTIVVPPNMEVQDVIIAENDILCFNALETVTLAGDGTFFIVESGGSAEVIAGQNILLKYGTNIHSGADFHAWITTNGEYCNLQTSLLAAFVKESIPEQQPLVHESMASFFKVYPNPTNGEFTIEVLDFEEDSGIQVEIYTIQGQLVLSHELPAERFYNFSLSHKQPGTYLIRVLMRNEAGVAKIIKSYTSNP